MSKRTMIFRSARVSSGVFGVAIIAVAVVSATLLPMPSVVADPPSALVRPQPTEQQRVCAGGIVRLAADGAQDATTALFLSSPGVSSSTTATEVPESTTLDTPDVQAVGAAAAGAPEVLTAPGSENGEPTLLAGAQSQTSADEELVGYSASACVEAASDSWLAAGSTVVGRTSLVVLSNPSDVTATVDLTVFGERGPISAPGASGIAIPAGTQRVIPLAGLAPNVTSPVLRVESRGGQVAATLQQSIIRGLQPGGVEITGPTAGPALTQVIPGMRVAETADGATSEETAPTDESPADAAPDDAAPTEDASAEDAQDGEDLHAHEGSDTETALRVFVPGEEDARLTVGVTAEDGASGGTSFELDIPAGRVTDIPFLELEEGLYTATIESTVPIVTSARSSTGGGEDPVDFSWFVAPTGPLTDDTLVAVPAGPSPRVHIDNPGPTPVDVVLTASAGADIRMRVPAAGSTSAPVRARTAYTISSTEPVYASVTFVGKGQSSAYPVNPASPSASPIRVYP